MDATATPARVFEFAVEFGFNFEYFEVPGLDEKTARDKLWNEILTCDQRDKVSSIECTATWEGEKPAECCA